LSRLLKGTVDIKREREERVCVHKKEREYERVTERKSQRERERIQSHFSLPFTSADG